MDNHGYGAVMASVSAGVQLRDEETAFQEEAMERWLDDAGTSEKVSRYDDRAFSGGKKRSTCRRRHLHMTTQQYRQFRKG